MRLNEVIKEVGMTKRAVKYYEEKGLLYKVKLHANVNITEEMISEWLKNYNENR